MKKLFRNFFQPYLWLEKWTFSKNGSFLFLILIFSYLTLSLSNQRWTFPYFNLFYISFTCIIIAAIGSESRYVKRINKIRALTAKQKGFQKANLLYLKFEQTNWTGIIALAVVLIFSIGGLLMFGAISVNPTLIMCLIYFGVTVYLSIVGYVQYIQLLVYIIQLANDREQYENIIDIVADKLPSEVDWLKQLTQLTHFYRSVFFSVGTFYILAFGFYCYAPDFLAMSNHIAYYILWGIIFVAIVVAFPIISLVEFFKIKKIVSKIKATYIIEIKKTLDKKTANEKTDIERRILTHLFSTSIIKAPDYPIKSKISVTYAIILTFTNIMGSVQTIIHLGERFIT